MISAVMIGRDAAAFVGASLRALAPIADEIVFVDTGSTDDTRAIAEGHGCRTFAYAWCDDFAAARNAAKAHARGEWILSVDTDEIVRGDRAIIDRAIDSDLAPAYLVSQDNLTDAGGSKPNPVLRLFRNDPRIAWRNPVHECVSESVLEHFAIRAFPALDLHLEHRGYTAAHVAGKHARNLAILERWAREQPTAFGLFCLGHALLDLGRPADAVVELARAHALLADPAVRRRAAYLEDFVAVFQRALAA